jgi:adenylylsulfate kinase
MKGKILVMGLPGAGKTWLAERLAVEWQCAWFNADRVRAMANDWEFSPEARIRQAERMRNIADFEKSKGRRVICDFVCPTKETRETFDADYVIYLDTIKEGRFEDTNKMFESPIGYEGNMWRVDKFYSDDEIKEMAKKISHIIDAVS